MSVWNLVWSSGCTKDNLTPPARQDERWKSAVTFIEYVGGALKGTVKTVEGGLGRIVALDFSSASHQIP